MNAGADVTLQPGQTHVGAGATRIHTVLGSCVSIVLWHPALRVGAMSHFMLPTRGGEPPRAGAALDGRYGDEALALLLAALAQAGATPVQCQGQLFGGGDMFPAQPRHAALQVGRRNGLAARALLRRHRIELVHECLFGVGHRRVSFDVASGAVASVQVPPLPLAASVA